jgi:hypothetical protein
VATVTCETHTLEEVYAAAMGGDQMTSAVAGAPVGSRA